MTPPSIAWPRPIYSLAQPHRISNPSLTVALEGQRVVLLPGGAPGAAVLVAGVALDVEAAVGLSGRGEAAELAVLVDRVGDPVDAGIVADGLVHGVDKDDLEVLVGGILVTGKARGKQSGRGGRGSAWQGNG